jgi:hypothetical protein
MATLVLTTVGRAVGGPLGAIVGAMAGGAIDRAALGAGGRRPAPADLAVQGANYGDPLPLLFGTIRACGQVIWSSGVELREGDGKTDGGRSYAASFAVALSRRPIEGVGRVWADSRLVRDAAGALAVAGSMRVHRGLMDQQPDPLIAAAEGAGGAPAYRGLAYAVFEELALAEFGNRIPQLSFEVFADAAAPTISRIAVDLFKAAGEAAPDAVGLDRPIHGYGVARAVTLGACLEQLDLCEPLEARAAVGRVALRQRFEDAAAILRRDEVDPRVGGAPSWRSAARSIGDGAPGSIGVHYLDVDRDLQPGLQRATRRNGGPAQVKALPAALSAAAAKGIAQRMARDATALAESRVVGAPIRFAAVETGDVIAFEGEARLWRTRRATVSGLTVELELDAVGRGGAPAAAAADPGRIDPNPWTGQGSTIGMALDLPALPWETPSEPRLVIAAGAAGAFWRRAEALLSLDGGASWRSVGAVSRRAVIGAADTLLGAGPADRWDDRNAIVVTVLNEQDWLQPASRAAVLAGANLALLGGEIVQFASAEPLGARRFRLQGLLRGRFGTEAAVAGHAVGESFLLLDPATLVATPVPVTMIGGQALVKLLGPLDEPGGVPQLAVEIRGRALLPYAPTRLTATPDDAGGVELAWTQRGPDHRAWADGASPVAATFQLVVTAGSTSRTLAVSGERWLATAADQSEMFGGSLTAFTTRVAQAHPQAGLGLAAEAFFSLGG